MSEQYPKMIYKSTDDYIIVNSIEEETKEYSNGYGEPDEMLFGVKPTIIEMKSKGKKAKVIEPIVEIVEETIIETKIDEVIAPIE